MIVEANQAARVSVRLLYCERFEIAGDGESWRVSDPGNRDEIDRHAGRTGVRLSTPAISTVKLLSVRFSVYGAVPHGETMAEKSK